MTGRMGGGGGGFQLCRGTMSYFVHAPLVILTDFQPDRPHIALFNSDFRLAPRGHGAPRRWRV